MLNVKQSCLRQLTTDQIYSVLERVGLTIEQREVATTTQQTKHVVYQKKQTKHVAEHNWNFFQES